MAKSSKMLKYVGIVAIVYFVGRGATNKITRNINYSFTSLRMIDFWGNIRRLKIELELGMTIENTNDILVTVNSFDGHLTYKEAQMMAITQNIAVILKPRVRQPVRFKLQTGLLGAAAKLYLAVTADRKRIEGCRIKGDLDVTIEGVRFYFQYDEPVTIDL